MNRLARHGCTRRIQHLLASPVDLRKTKNKSSLRPYGGPTSGFESLKSCVLLVPCWSVFSLLSIAVLAGQRRWWCTDEEEAKTILEPPADGFMMWTDYRREVSNSLNTKMGHKKHNHDGVEGILLPYKSIPNPPPPSLWKIRRQFSKSSAKKQLLAANNPFLEAEGPEGSASSSSVVAAALEEGFAAQKEAVTGKDYLKRMASMAGSVAVASTNRNKSAAPAACSDDELVDEAPGAFSQFICVSILS